MTFKRKQVVMLPTNEKAKVGQFEIFSYDETSMIEGKDWKGKINCGGVVVNIPALKQTKQHLYILSDEEIETKDDWFYNIFTKVIFQVKDFTEYDLKQHKKIIATTDESLNLPQLPYSFINKYVKGYNEGNFVTEIMVEYKDFLINQSRLGLPNIIERRIKVKSKDNTITIKKIKDIWTRAEVIALHKLNCERLTNAYTSEDIKWIKENL